MLQVNLPNESVSGSMTLNNVFGSVYGTGIRFCVKTIIYNFGCKLYPLYYIPISITLLPFFNAATCLSVIKNYVTYLLQNCIYVSFSQHFTPYLISKLILLEEIIKNFVYCRNEFIFELLRSAVDLSTVISTDVGVNFLIR